MKNVKDEVYSAFHKVTENVSDVYPRRIGRRFHNPVYRGRQQCL